jgi:hypothetical protein
MSVPQKTGRVLWSVEWERQQTANNAADALLSEMGGNAPPIVVRYEYPTKEPGILPYKEPNRSLYAHVTRRSVVRQERYRKWADV